MTDFINDYYINKNLEDLKKLTIIIPTYNRNYYLSRCLWYHAHFPFREIIIADSSQEEKKIINREIISKIQDVFDTKIKYLEYNPETEKYGGDVYRKWVDAVIHVNSKYSQIVTDKEFVVPSGLIDAIQYLEKHPDYIASDAEYLYLDERNSEYIFRPRKNNRHSEINQEPLDRFHDAFVITQPAISNCLIPSIMRSESRKTISIEIAPTKVNDIRLGELVLGFYGYFLGKFNYNPNKIFLIRDVSVLESQKRMGENWGLAESSNTRYPRMEEYIKTKQTELFNAFRSSLSSYLVTYARLTKIDADRFVAKKYPDKYFMRYDLDRQTLIKKIGNNFKIIRNIWNLCPESVREMGSKISLICFKQPLSQKPIYDTRMIDDAELNLIIKVVRDSIYLHDDDTPITKDRGFPNQVANQ